MTFPRLAEPIVGAPLAGGPSTPELAAAISAAGGLGFLAAGYASAASVRAGIARVRELTDARFGVNLFVLTDRPVDDAAVARYAGRLRGEGTPTGEPRFDDDAYAEKLELLLEERVPVVSATFGCPTRDVIDRLHERGIAIWVTVTEVDEALRAGELGVDALVVQGVEAGGHRGTFDDVDGRGELGLLSLLRLVARRVDLPLVAAGGIADGPGVAAALAAGARAAQIGTAFLRSPEAGTSNVHRAALTGTTPTALTRAFTGRRARGIENAFMRAHRDAPSAYPHVAHVTAPLRAAARDGGDAEATSLFAGQAYPLASDEPAGELVRRLGAEARAALAEAAARVG